jgi:hypothetical protein
MNALMGADLKRLGYPDTACTATPLDHLAGFCFRSGVFYLWTRLVEKHLPAHRARRRAVRQDQQLQT